MGKSISFADRDKELVNRIQEFQQKNGLTHFIDAVRKLCEIGLQFEKTVSQLKK